MDEMERDKAPAMYAINHGKCLYVLYWHQGDRLEEASKKAVSCNFVRYLMDLARTVYVCLDEADLAVPVSLVSPSRVLSRHHRTQRMHIAPVSHRKGEVEVKTGFHICPDSLKDATKDVRLFGGMHRVGVLKGVQCPPISKRSVKQVSLPPNELPEFIAARQREGYSIEWSQLAGHEAGLQVFLESAGIPETAQFERSKASTNRTSWRHGTGTSWVPRLSGAKSTRVWRRYSLLLWISGFNSVCRGKRNVCGAA